MRQTKTYIFEKDAYFASCHASTVLPLPNGDVLAAWFGGSAEGKDDVRIYTARRTGGAWEKPMVISSAENLPHWNPVLHLRQDGTVRLFYKKGKPIADWVTYYTDSLDGGQSWQKPQVLVPGDTSGGRGPVKNKCITTRDGLLLAPASTEKHRQWRCFIDISADDGNTWHRSPYIVRPRSKVFGLAQMIQPTLWEDGDGVIHAFMRSNQGAVYRSRSLDGGRTWKRAADRRLFSFWGNGNHVCRTLCRNGSGADCRPDRECDPHRNQQNRDSGNRRTAGHHADDGV